MDCSEVLQQLADYLDEDARAELCRQIESHLSRCHDCQMYVDTVKKTIVLYQHDREIPVPLGISQQLKVAMAQVYARGREATGD